MWRVSLDGSDLEMIVSESLSTSLSTRTISTVIDDNIYYTSKYYLASYDMENERFVYKYFPDYLGKKFAIFNDQGNVLYPGDKEIVELTPDLVEKRRISNFKSIDGTSNELDHFRTNLNIYNSGDYLAIADFHNPDRIINLKDSTIYRVGQDSDQCLVVGLDSNYVYFTADRDEDYFYKLYRLPLGEYSMNKKEYLWDVLDVDIQNGYAIDIRLMGNKNEIWLYNLSTGDNRQVASTSSSEVFVDGNYLYYSSMMNGGLYKVPLSGGKAQRIIKRKGYIADFVLTNDSIYSFIWKDGLQLVEMGLNGENYRSISSDKLGVFYDINDRYFIFQGTEKWASFSLKNQTIELIGNLERNFEVKKAVEVKKDMVTEQK